MMFKHAGTGQIYTTFEETVYWPICRLSADWSGQSADESDLQKGWNIYMDTNTDHFIPLALRVRPLQYYQSRTLPPE